MTEYSCKFDSIKSITGYLHLWHGHQWTLEARMMSPANIYGIVDIMKTDSSNTEMKKWNRTQEGAKYIEKPIGL